MKKVVIVLILLSFSVSFSQNSINSYKYIIIQKQYEFQKTEDQHQLNSLAKFLFEKEGFTTFFTDEQIPTDLATNSCLALKVKINSKPSFLTTKLTINLLDCNQTIIFSSKEGKSKLKDFTKAYHDALRKAFESIKQLNYQYETPLIQPKEEVVSSKLQNEQKNQKEEKALQVKEVVKKKAPKALKQKKINEAKSSFTIEGNFDFKQWGTSKIMKEGVTYNVIGGSEGFNFAKVYKTSKPNLYIIKWVTNKEPRLVEIDDNGNLIIDTENGKELYKRID